MHLSRRLAIAAVALVFFAARPALAHHSYTMFNMEKEVTVDGTVKEVQWANPHVWIQVVAKDPATGKDVEWSVEAGSPNMLSRTGWKRTSLKAGDKAVVVIHPLKVGGSGNSGSLATVTVNGQRIFGGPGTAAAVEEGK